MKKLTKATLAGALGVVLLAGGTTFALWNDSATVNGGTVNSGTLALTPSETGTWNDLSSGTPQEITDISAFLIVPGDEIQFTSSYTVRASGDNLTATIDVSDPVDAAGDAELVAATTVTQRFTDESGTPVADRVITSANNGDVITVTVNIVFDSTTEGTLAQGQTLNLADLTVTLAQTTTP
ncbi:alternate-type signal peptide domain-containing protein [Paramicrobacterium agarici]|uniref:alternate-type signal peptide domain-containing protein n=1 Tax=Paramicrobacterium agarici TaxID=630514 RepID=UPI001173D5F4|nr:alternate-type signal peptide domain-containing protein [Microbacterium agarici]TQO22418.1 alternate signal-mediated exported protein [Microbacterium agarici]